MNSSIFILMVIMFVNALSYGTIIPLLYPYAARFGINPSGLGLLLASFSLAQFISTPILGRLSDKFGRKPVLLLCLLGTSLSLGLFAIAKTVTVLFIARIIDGVTGGNISVAQAVIADKTEGDERTKAFGFLGAAFGFGFVFGPALGGLMSEISITAPFWFAAALGMAGTLAGVVFLHETLPKEKRQLGNEPLFPIRSLFTSLSIPLTGVILAIGFITSVGQNAWIIGFQSFTVDILKLSTRNVGLLFTTAGLVNIFMQGVGIKLLMDTVKSAKNILFASLLLSSVLLFFMAFAHTFAFFAVLIMIYMIVLSPQNIMMSTMLSERTKAEDQGAILGINQAYLSLGQIVGPVMAAYVIGFSIHYVFILTALLFLLATGCTKYLYIPVKTKLDL